MGDIGKGAKFLFEANDRRGISALQRFECNDFSALAIIGPIHIPHAAVPEITQDFITGDRTVKGCRYTGRECALSAGRAFSVGAGRLEDAVDEPGARSEPLAILMHRRTLTPCAANRQLECQQRDKNCLAVRFGKRPEIILDTGAAAGVPGGFELMERQPRARR